jgi:hypothetical protein
VIEGLAHFLNIIGHYFVAGGKCAFSIDQQNLLAGALTKLLDSVLREFQSSVHYIFFRPFIDELAPIVWPPCNDGKRRRFVCWNHPLNDLSYVFGLLVSTTALCGTVIKYGDAGIRDQACTGCIPGVLRVLEFVGLMHLEMSSTFEPCSDTSYRFRRHQVVTQWKPFKPTNFYKKYANLLVHIPGSELEREAILLALQRWQQSTLSEDGAISDGMLVRGEETEVAMLGISMRCLRAASGACEAQCLRLLLNIIDTLEFPYNSRLTCISDNIGILFQNMDSRFRISSNLPVDEDNMRCAVLYLSLLTNICSSSSSGQRLLMHWWYNHNHQTTHMALVEIVNDKGRLHRIFFPVPLFVKTFKDFPEVVKAQNKLMHQIDRTGTPEDKIHDFCDRIPALIRVMARQAVLRATLTPFVHWFFGGRTILPVGWMRFPDQRVLLLCTTLLLNTYYLFVESLSWEQVVLSLPQFFEILWVSPWRHICVSVTKALHLAMTSSLLMRHILNSPKADYILAGKSAIHIPLAVWWILFDSMWSIFLAACSLGGLYNYIWLYVPCLLDMTQVFPYMSFLVEAVRRNAFGIAYTVILAITVLYMFSIMAFLFFKDQYGFNGHSGCVDPASCFKLHVDYGLSQPPLWNGDSYIQSTVYFWSNSIGSAVFGSIYTIIYIILINLVMQSIISGLIIDTFSAMRSENERIEADMTSRCFVCGISKGALEKGGISFEEHTRRDHHSWNYVWLKIYLDGKDATSLSRTELWAREQMADGVAFAKLFPVHRAMALEDKNRGPGKL